MKCLNRLCSLHPNTCMICENVVVISYGFATNTTCIRCQTLGLARESIYKQLLFSSTCFFAYQLNSTSHYQKPFGTLACPVSLFFLQNTSLVAPWAHVSPLQKCHHKDRDMIRHRSFKNSSRAVGRACSKLGQLKKTTSAADGLLECDLPKTKDERTAIMD